MNFSVLNFILGCVCVYIFLKYMHTLLSPYALTGTRAFQASSYRSNRPWKTNCMELVQLHLLCSSVSVDNFVYGFSIYLKFMVGGEEKGKHVWRKLLRKGAKK